ncbi:hypothetical protein [Nostoc commune]|uniref:hypothetical protein n=1 Tax=Nostoc commune TaxID=1178 RepID=UPI0020749C3D|nr:hypothetical protein [Nostoc commune]
MTILLFSGDAGHSLLRRSQVQSEKMSILANLAAEVADKISYPVSLNVVNLQLALDEVFDVRS